MPVLHTSDLSRYVNDAIAAPGGYEDPAIVAKYEPLRLLFDTVVDQGLSPFSDKYFDQQMALYREISGRDLDQQQGELHNEDVERLRHAPNPTGIKDAAVVAEYVRCVSSMLALSCLRGKPSVLDMGAGHGLGSEIIAYTGCSVHAVDIDPELGALSRDRVAPRNLNVTRSDLNFDDLSSLEDGKYHGAFFFQALHHCLRPWKLIADLKTKLSNDGIIAFVGEPIQNLWWQHWGLRLDPVSLFVARRDGWFESGWSHAFIRDCFARSGFHLAFFTGGYGGDEIGIATLGEAKRQQVLARARKLGLQETYTIGSIGSDRQYLSNLGIATTLCGRPAFRQIRKGPEALVYGPYAAVTAGRYEVSMIAALVEPSFRLGRSGDLNIDIVHSSGNSMLFRAHERARRTTEPRMLRYIFEISSDIQDLEVRAFPDGASDWIVSVPIIQRIDEG